MRETTFKQDGYTLTKRVYETLDHERDWSAVTASQVEQGRIPAARFTLTKTRDDSDGDDLYIGQGTITAMRRGRRAYPKTEWDGYVMRRGSKFSMSLPTTGHDLSPLFNAVLRHLRLECLTLPQTEYNDGDAMIDQTLYRALANGVVMKKVLRGTVRNRRDLIRAYLSAAYGIKKADIAVADAYLQDTPGQAPSLADLNDYTTDLNKAMTAWGKVKENARRHHTDRDESVVTPWLFRDLLRDCIMLGTRMNPSWTARRMKEEHDANTDRLALLHLEECDTTDIYGERAVDTSFEGLRIACLRTERDALAEATAMHNCIHTHYWSQIRDGRYAVLASDGEDHCDTGLRLDGDGNVVIDQIHSKFNAAAPAADRSTMERFVETHQRDLRRLFGTSAGDALPF